MRANEFIKEGDVIQGPWDKNVPSQTGLNLYSPDGEPVKGPVDTSSMEKIPMHQAFGQPEYSAIRGAGFKFDEKPGYMSEIRSEISLHDLIKIENLIKREINSYQINRILTPRKGEYYPQTNAKFENLVNPNEETFILWLPETNDRFLVNRTGSKSYIRMWARIVS